MSRRFDPTEAESVQLLPGLYFGTEDVQYYVNKHSLLLPHTPRRVLDLCNTVLHMDC